ncbi:MAG TPA: hypothetical protein EYP67_02110 [Methanosarcinales archaeon]|nr:hypothetical protein [Methanosarcinales archaeon]
MFSPTTIVHLPRGSSSIRNCLCR